MVVVTTILNIIIELSQMIRKRGRYFQISNLIDWIIYMTTIIFLTNICIPYETDGCKGFSVSKTFSQ